MLKDEQALLACVGKKVSGILWNDGQFPDHFSGHPEATIVFTDGSKLHLGGNCYAGLSTEFEELV